MTADTRPDSIPDLEDDSEIRGLGRFLVSQHVNERRLIVDAVVPGLLTARSVFCREAEVGREVNPTDAAIADIWIEPQWYLRLSGKVVGNS